MESFVIFTSPFLWQVPIIPFSFFLQYFLYIRLLQLNFSSHRQELNFSSHLLLQPIYTWFARFILISAVLFNFTLELKQRHQTSYFSLGFIFWWMFLLEFNRCILSLPGDPLPNLGHPSNDIHCHCLFSKSLWLDNHYCSTNQEKYDPIIKWFTFLIDMFIRHSYGLLRFITSNKEGSIWMACIHYIKKGPIIQLDQHHWSTNGCFYSYIQVC